MPPALEQIRTLADPNSITGTKGVGIVLIGSTEVYSKMKGKQEAQFAQLFSRIKMSRYYSTSNVTDDDVEKLFPVLKKQGMKKELGFLKGICKSGNGASEELQTCMTTVSIMMMYLLKDCMQWQGLLE